MDRSGPGGRPESGRTAGAMGGLVAAARATADAALAADVLRRYGFAVPTGEALDLAAAWSPNGVVEVGAGTGYWAAELTRIGVDVIAYDVEPPPSLRNRWFAGARPWFPVVRGDERVADHCPERSLLLVWPTRNETWAADAVARHHDAGGDRVLYVGEATGGRTGDASLHARLGEVGSCLVCVYDIADAACTCGIDPLWRRVDEVALPAWQGEDVRLGVYSRSHGRRHRQGGVRSPGRFGRRRRSTF